MLYSLTKPFAKVTLSIYFRKLYLSNLEVIPRDKPVLFAANHPTAFLEPCILACWLPKPLHFIARGDLYQNNRFLRKIYDLYHMTPVFRLEDTGYGNLRSNYRSFDRCFDLFKERKQLMILAEGRTLHEKRLRPIMKGTARIVFGALEKYGDLDIQVIPVGVNYTNPDKFRSLVMIDFGEPIQATSYTAMYQENPARAINELTRELEIRLKERVVHIENKEDDDITGTLLEIYENDLPVRLFPVVLSDDEVLRAEKQITDFVNELSGEGKQQLTKWVSSYQALLSSHQITDLGIVHQKMNTWQQAAWVMIGWLPSFMGKLLNGLPIWTGNSIAEKIAPSIEFRASTAVVFSAMLYLIYWITTGILLKSWEVEYGFLIWTGIPVLGYFHVIFQDFYVRWNESRKLRHVGEEALDELKQRRNEIKGSVPGYQKTASGS